MVALTEAVTEWSAWCADTQRSSPGSVRNNLSNLGKLAGVTGNIQVRNVTPLHVDRMLASLTRLTPGGRNNVLISCRSFFKWAETRGYCRGNPAAGSRMLKVPVKHWRRLNVGQFPALLDSARNPRDRGLLAVAVYLLLRQGEITTLRVGDVNLDAGEIRVTVHKSGGHQEAMPICAELDAELRAWLTAYSSKAGNLQPDWLLFPARHVTRTRIGSGGRFVETGEFEYLTGRQMTRPERIAQHALNSVGFNTRDDAGVSLHEGMHTLRRSSARAIFDTLVDDSYDGALRIVQAMLHHASSVTTEKYLGLTLDKKRRDDLFTGRPMFPAATAANIVQLKEASGG